MKYNCSVIITLIMVITLLFVTTITIGPLNKIQIKNASAQNQAGPNPIISSQMPSISNPPTLTNSNHSIPSKGPSISNPPTLTIISPNFTGSISTFSPLINGIKASVNVSLADAIFAADRFLGNNTITVAAFVHPERGFIIYDLLTFGSNNNAFRIIVDPGNGKILSSQQISKTDATLMLHDTGSNSNGMKDFEMMLAPNMGMDKARP